MGEIVAGVSPEAVLAAGSPWATVPGMFPGPLAAWLGTARLESKASRAGSRRPRWPRSEGSNFERDAPLVTRRLFGGSLWLIVMILAGPA
ncbi:hypothetical protein [Sorangium sp. So ce145]|uniref:hypothetical protein n=1 Tax=Sorangium sp. So ce145 TaxID=3133285 RepID=UPI003F624596